MYADSYFVFFIASICPKQLDSNVRKLYWKKAREAVIQTKQARAFIDQMNVSVMSWVLQRGHP